MVFVKGQSLDSMGGTGGTGGKVVEGMTSYGMPFPVYLPPGATLDDLEGRGGTTGGYGWQPAPNVWGWDVPADVSGYSGGHAPHTGFVWPGGRGGPYLRGRNWDPNARGVVPYTGGKRLRYGGRFYVTGGRIHRPRNRGQPLQRSSAARPFHTTRHRPRKARIFKVKKATPIHKSYSKLKKERKSLERWFKHRKNKL